MTCPKCGDSRLRPDGQDEGWYYCLGCWTTVNLLPPMDLPEKERRFDQSHKPRGREIYDQEPLPL